MSKTGSRRWLGSGRAPRTLLPGDVRLLGWWSSGPLPGSPAGTVVIDGHVDDRGGPGALFRLARTPVGSALVLQTPAGVLRYVMQARRRHGKDQLPGDLFTAAGRPRLVLHRGCGEAAEAVDYLRRPLRPGQRALPGQRRALRPPA